MPFKKRFLAALMILGVLLGVGIAAASVASAGQSAHNSFVSTRTVLVCGAATGNEPNCKYISPGATVDRTVSAQGSWRPTQIAAPRTLCINYRIVEEGEVPNLTYYGPWGTLCGYRDGAWLNMDNLAAFFGLSNYRVEVVSG